ncbi:hypothetical protein KEJ21_00145 [Candidatus Bathyarchaeota archaeon]|nr:hypothetical protein [Candidatus Bathyarchaeota archaeon]MBS7630179.1 hypothetical protein [Candidatus Bathyarchaeota archaeon]
MREKRGFWSRLEDIPREVLYGLLLIAFIIPMIKPIGFPVPVSPETQKWYDTIDKLPAGSVIMIDFGYSGGGEPELGPMAVAVYHHIFKRGGLKAIAMSTSIEGPLLWDKAMAEVNPSQYGAQYGVDYIHIGYIAGTETAMAAVGKDLRATTSTDYKGNPLDQYPIMEGIKDASSFDLLIVFTTGGDQSEGWVRQWVTPYKTPYLCSVLAMMKPTMLPYQKAGQIIALTSGAQAGEMEYLVKVPARGIKSADVMTLTHLLIVVYVIVGNIAYYGKKYSGG